MNKVYLVWQNDKTILGVANTEKNAQNMCQEFGDSYMPIELNVATRENIETTHLCTYKTEQGFLTYQQAIAQNYTFEDD